MFYNMKQINFNNSLKAMLVTLTLIFMAAVSATAQNWLPADQAKVKVEQELNKLSAPSKLALPANNTLTTTQSSVSPAVHANAVISTMKAIFLMEVGNHLKQGSTTEQAYNNAFNVPTPAGQRNTNLNEVKTWVASVLQ
jgi:asparagine synthetase A